LGPWQKSKIKDGFLKLANLQGPPTIQKRRNKHGRKISCYWNPVRIN